MSLRKKVVSIGDFRRADLNGVRNRNPRVRNARSQDPGLAMVRRLYQSAQIDPEWSIVHERGFSWWAHHYRQRIWADEPFENNGLRITRVHAQTDLLRYPQRSEDWESPLSTAMSRASLSGPVLCEDTNQIGLHCHVLVHNENLAFVEPLFNMAVFLQAYDAEFKAEAMAEALGIETDPSDHPDSGPRPEMDQILEIVDRYVIPHGSEPFTQISQGDLEDAAAGLAEFDIISNKGRGGIIIGVVDLYIGSEQYPVCMLNVSAAAHPALGKGLLFIHRMPSEVFTRRGITLDGRFILDLNTWAARHSTACHGLGSWCLDLLIEDEVLATYVTFIPAVACNQNALSSMSLFTAGHAFSLVNYIQDRGL